MTTLFTLFQYSVRTPYYDSLCGSNHVRSHFFFGSACPIFTRPSLVRSTKPALPPRERTWSIPYSFIMGHYRPIGIIFGTNSSCQWYIHFTHLSGHSNPLISCWCWDAYVCRVELHAYLHTNIRTYVQNMYVKFRSSVQDSRIQSKSRYSIPLVLDWGLLGWLGWLSEVSFLYCILPDIHSEAVSEATVRCEKWQTLACYSCWDYGIIRSDHTALRSITSLIDRSMDRVRSGGFHLVSQSSRSYHGFRIKRQRSWMKRNETKQYDRLHLRFEMKWQK